MTPTKTLQKFFTRISWAEKPIMIDDDILDTIATDGETIFYPHTWQDFDGFKRAATLSVNVSMHSQMTSWLIVDGSLTDDECARVWAYKSSIRIDAPNVISFLDACAELKVQRHMRQALDGVDWKRTIEGHFESQLDEPGTKEPTMKKRLVMGWD